jgi:adenosylcobinamide-phosphate synthase
MDESLLSSSAALLSSAFILDLAVGDPRWLPHPVVLMGKAIAWGEKILWSGAPRRDFISGTLLTLTIVALFSAMTWAMVAAFAWLWAPLTFMGTVILASTTLATRGLLDAVARIEESLRAGDIVRARAQLSHIVGRDTGSLNEDKVARAALESLAENTSDGIVAPLFYLFLGGLPLAVAYKAVNTLDSMIGYRTVRYSHFGKFAARLDDAFNFIPARLTAFFIVVATLLMRLNGALAAKILWRDHGNSLSPNAGYPEAALAGALGIKLGGPSVYFGNEMAKPYIGDELAPLDTAMLKEARSVCFLTAVLSLITFVLASTARF